MSGRLGQRVSGRGLSRLAITSHHDLPPLVALYPDPGHPYLPAPDSLAPSHVKRVLGLHQTPRIAQFETYTQLFCSRHGWRRDESRRQRRWGNGVEGHVFGFRGYLVEYTRGFGMRSGAAERPTVTLSCPLTARRRCLTVVEGSECRNHRRHGAYAAAVAVNSTGGAAAGSDRRLGTATQRPHAGTLDCSRGRTPLRRSGRKPEALRDGVDRHCSGFRGCSGVYRRVWKALCGSLRGRLWRRAAR